MRSILELLLVLGTNISYIAELIQKFVGRVNDEDLALDQLKRYGTTEEIHNEDGRRDNAFRRICDIIRAGHKHFDESKRAAAVRLGAIVKEYKGTPNLPMPEESAAIHNLLQKFETVRADTDLLGLDGWITELKDANDRVRSLMTDRESEAATKAQYKMKLVRAETDRQYAEILTCLEAAAIIDGVDTCKQLFDEINARIDEYNNILAREKGWRNSKKSDLEPDEEDVRIAD
ncbi:MAG: DUF6261 family protein [Tannerella sp.]|nr:DUF6261 family protein [Tannerella sp.]